MEGEEVISVIEEHIKSLEPDKQMPALLALSTTLIGRFTTSSYEWIGAIDAMKQVIYLAPDRKEEKEE